MWVKAGKGEGKVIDDLSTLKNSELADVDYVKVFDTATRIPPTTVLIDTPGLSSSNPRHRQALVSFLPEADGILLVMDINAQLSRSTIEFINTICLSERPIYLIITHCDTKTQDDRQRTINNIKEHLNLPFKRIICTSSKSGYLDEMYSLLDEIEKDKFRILEKVNSARIKSISEDILQRIDVLLSSKQDDKDLLESIQKQKLELKRVQTKIDGIFESARNDIEKAKVQVSREFEDSVFGKLDSLVAGKSVNFDAEAISIVNNTSSLALNNFKTRVKQMISEASSQGKAVNVSLPGLAELDMSGYSIDGISYNLNLNQTGHEYDCRIAMGLKIAAAVGAVVATSGIASSASGAAKSASGSVAVLQTVDTVTDVADTISDVGSMVSNRNNVQIIQGLITKTQGEFDNFEAAQQGIGQRLGSDKGIVESMVGLVTDSAFGKPQRRRAIHEYVDNTLLPAFKSELSRISSELEARIKQMILAESAIYTQEMTSALESLLQAQKQGRVEYKKYLSSLNEYKNELLTNIIQ